MNSSSGLSAASNTPAVMNAVSAGNRRGSVSCPSMRGYDAIHSLPLASALAWCTGIAVVSIALSAILFRRRTAA